MPNSPSAISFHPYEVISLRLIVFWSAWLHTSVIQHVLFQWCHKASTDRIMLFSQLIRAQTASLISSNHSVCISRCVDWTANLLKCDSGELVSKPESFFLKDTVPISRKKAKKLCWYSSFLSDVWYSDPWV